MPTDGRKKITSPAKLKLGEFLKTTDMEQTFLFGYRGTPERATTFVHRMRVELSRLRNKLKERGRRPASFKMLLINIKPDPDDPEIQLITLKKTKHELDVSDELSSILDNLDGGALIDVEKSS